MEYIINNQKVLAQLPALSPNGIELSSSSQPFIEANTIAMPINELKYEHIIPVWSSNNEPLISHAEFIEATWEEVHHLFPNEIILKPNVRVSHPIKGRIPEARNKPAKDLQPWEQTIYYERAMFVIELPSIQDEINGNLLSLTIGGVKSYSLDNLYSKRPSGDQHFQLFIGFQNKVCCNLCVFTDGFKHEIGIKSLPQIKYVAQHMISQFQISKQLTAMKMMNGVELTEKEFAQVIGRCRMYKHLPNKSMENLTLMLLGDQQINTVVDAYYNDNSFGNKLGGSISGWNFYNLLTGANKSTYIDSFLERGVNATDFTTELLKHKTGIKQSWFMG
jgi:hypothetical protein